MYGYIYETENLVNGKKYIGQHKSGDFDPGYKGSGVLLWKAIGKYGWDNFSTKIMCPCFYKDELNSEEIILIDYFNAVSSDRYYNLAKGGVGNDYRSDEWRSKVSLANSGRVPIYCDSVITYTTPYDLDEFLAEGWSVGYPKSTRHRMRLSHLGKPIHSEEYKQALSERMHTDNISKGLPKSEDWKKQMSSRMKGNSYTAGRIWINNGAECKLINPNDLESYLDMGYSIGRLRRCS